MDFPYFIKLIIIVSYFSHPRQSSGNHAPKCLPFSILCAKSVIIHTSITYNMIKTGVGVNCNNSYSFLYEHDVVVTRLNVCNKKSKAELLQNLSIFGSSRKTDVVIRYNNFT